MVVEAPFILQSIKTKGSSEVHAGTVWRPRVRSAFSHTRFGSLRRNIFAPGNGVVHISKDWKCYLASPRTGTLRDCKMRDIEDLVVSTLTNSHGPNSLEEVVTSGLCCSCGACEAVLGLEVVHMAAQAPYSRLRPVFHRTLTTDEQTRALSVCPGAVVGSQDEAGGQEGNALIGKHVSVHMGHAGDAEVRYQAAAGGGLTSLAIHLLESGEVQCIVHANPSAYHGDTKMLGSRVSRTRDEVVGGCGSRYAPTSVLQGVGNVIATGEAFALIGKPCDINAMVNGMRGGVWQNANCKYLLTLSCGMYHDATSADAFLDLHDVAASEVERWQWRGRGCPGDCPGVQTRSGEYYSMDYVDWWASPPSAHSHVHTYQWRCKICPDFLGLQADVVVMDSWPGNSPEHRNHVTPAREWERDGWMYVVARTSRGHTLVKAAEAVGHLTLYPDRTPSIQQIQDSQPHQVRRSLMQWSRRIAHARSGHPLPSLTPAKARMVAEAALSQDALAEYCVRGSHRAASPAECGGAAGVIAKAMCACGKPGQLKEDEVRNGVWELKREVLCCVGEAVLGTEARITRGDAKEDIVVESMTHVE